MGKTVVLRRELGSSAKVEIPWNCREAMEAALAMCLLLIITDFMDLSVTIAGETKMLIQSAGKAYINSLYT